MRLHFLVMSLNVVFASCDIKSLHMCGYFTQDLTKISKECKQTLISEMEERCKELGGTLMELSPGIYLQASGCAFLCEREHLVPALAYLKEGLPCGPLGKKCGRSGTCEADPCRGTFVNRNIPPPKS